MSRLKLSSIPSIATTSRVFATDQQRVLASGASRFLAKPIQFDELLAALTALLSVQWRYRDSIAPPSQTATIDPTVVPPDAAIIEQLYHLACIGDVDGIEQQLSQLSHDDDQSQAFIQVLRELTSTFQTGKIRQFLQFYTQVQSR